MTILAGNQAGSGGTYGRNSGQSRVSRFAVVTAGNADTITANVTSSPSDVALVVYSASGVNNNATTLLGYGIVPAGQTGLVSVPLNVPIELVQGQLIWLGLSESGFLLGDDNNQIAMENGVDPEDGVPETSFNRFSGQNYRAPIIFVEQTQAAGASVTAADDITDESQPATFTLSGNSAAPVSATLNGTDVGALTDQGAGVYSYTAPLIADDAAATLSVSVDGTTADTTISYANSLPYALTAHAEPDANSVMFGNQFATTGAVELADPVLVSGDAGAATIDWAAMDSAQGWTADINTYATANEDGTQTWEFTYLIAETNQTGTFQRTFTVGDGEITVDYPFSKGIRYAAPQNWTWGKRHPKTGMRVRIYK